MLYLSPYRNIPRLTLNRVIVVSKKVLFTLLILKDLKINKKHQLLRQMETASKSVSRHSRRASHGRALVEVAVAYSHETIITRTAKAIAIM